MDSTSISAQPDATQISRILENISKQLAVRSDSRSLQIFSATLSYCKSLIINELVWEGEETADYEDRLSLERRITDLTSQLNAEERSTQVTVDKYEAEAIEERKKILQNHETSMEKLNDTLQNLQVEVDMKLALREEKELCLRSSLNQLTGDFNVLATKHTAAIQSEEKEIEDIIQRIEEDESALTKLKQYYIMVDRNMQAIQKEKDALEKVKAMEDAATLILTNAATQIQRVTRGTKSRKETAKVKAKARKGGKGKNKRKEKATV
jgi:hypothetical protein